MPDKSAVFKGPRDDIKGRRNSNGVQILNPPGRRNTSRESLSVYWLYSMESGVPSIDNKKN